MQDVVVTGLNSYSTVENLRSFPYARVDDIPKFGKKERPDYVVYDEETDNDLDFISNNFDLPSEEIAQLYKYRWKVELFFYAK